MIFCYQGDSPATNTTGRSKSRAKKRDSEDGPKMRMVKVNLTAEVSQLDHSDPTEKQTKLSETKYTSPYLPRPFSFLFLLSPSLPPFPVPSSCLLLLLPFLPTTFPRSLPISLLPPSLPLPSLLLSFACLSCLSYTDCAHFKNVMKRRRKMRRLRTVLRHSYLRPGIPCNLRP